MKLWIASELDRAELIRLGLTVAAMIIFSLLILWLKSDIDRRAQTLQRLRREYAVTVQTSAIGSTLKIDFEQARPFLKALENMLPTKDLLLQLPKDFAAFASRQGTTFGSLFGAEHNGVDGAPGSVEITLTAQGQYDGIAAFIRAISQSRYLIRLTRIDLTERSGVYEAKIFGAVYFQ